MKTRTTSEKLFQPKKRYSRIFPATLAAILLLSFVFPIVASAAAAPIDKEEVVYVNLNTDGSVKGVYVVNILKDGGEFADYGNYSAIRNMTTFDNLTLDNGIVSGQTDVDKLYYEGILENVQIPWDISVRYFLDGKEYSASEIAGQSGNFELRISIKQNTRCNSTFFDKYALQTSITLDTKRCKNTKAAEATVANVGSNKQLTYTILPGNESEISITAEVTDFRMDAISINGVRLNLNIDFDDEELLDQVSELVDGILKVDDGAKELQDGTAELREAIKDDLLSGVSSLQSGASTLDEGIVTLRSGISEAQTGLNQLNDNADGLTNGSAQVKSALLEIQSALSSVSVTADRLAELTKASSQIKTGIDELNTGIGTLQSNIGYAQYKAAMSANGLDIDGLLTANSQTISDLVAWNNYVDDFVAEHPATAIYSDKIQQGKAQIAAVIELLKRNSAAYGGTEAYLNQLSTAVDSLYTGIGQLKGKYAEFDTAIGSLTDTLAGLLVDISTLSDGINQLVKEYSKLDSGIKEYTDGVATLAAGYSQIVGGMTSLANGSKELSSGISSLHNGTTDLYEGVTTLYDGTLELSDGTGEMREQTDGMDTEISDKVDSLLDSVSGGNDEVISFASEQNTSIQSVQFVIQTESIEEAAVSEAVVANEEKLSFGQKLLRLFGL